MTTLHAAAPARRWTGLLLALALVAGMLVGTGVAPASAVELSVTDTVDASGQRYRSYDVTPATDGTIVASLAWDEASGADLALFARRLDDPGANPVGPLLLVSKTGVEPEQVSFPAVAGTSYRLIVEATTGASSFDLGAELVDATSGTVRGTVDVAAGSVYRAHPVVVATDGMLTAELSWDDASADLGLYLRTAGGAVLETSRTSSSTERLSAEVPAGAYELLVRGESGASSYAVDVATQSGDDRAIIGQIGYVGANGTRQVYDSFDVVAPADGQLVATLSSDPTQNLDLFVRTVDGGVLGPIVTSSATTVSPEQLTYDVEAGDVLRLLVKANGTDASAFALDATWTQGTDRTIAGTSDPASQNWRTYPFAVPGPGALTAELDWTAPADLQLYLRAPNGSLAEVLKTDAQPEVFTSDVTTAGTYELVVASNGGATDFTIDTRFQTGVARELVGQVGFASASGVQLFESYDITTPADGTATVQVVPTDGDADLNLYVRRVDDPAAATPGPLLATSVTPATPEQLSFEATAATTYRVYVEAASGASHFVATTALQTGPDRTFLGTSDVAGQRYRTFPFTVADAGTLSGTLDWAGSEDLSLFLRDDTGATLDAATGADQPEVVTADVAPGAYEFVVASNSGATAFSLAATLEVAPPAVGGTATVTITPSGGLATASTFSANSIVVENTSSTGAQITGVDIDLSTGVLPDVVFDPIGTAGDATAKCLTIDSGAAATGLVAPGDVCVDPFSAPHDGVGVEEGYDVLSLAFDDFGPGESLGLSVDIDPTTIKDQPNAGQAGSIAGVEMVGATVTVTYADGASATGELWYLSGSPAGAVATVDASSPTTVPSLDVQDVELEPGPTADHTAALVNTAAQTVVVSGLAEGDEVALVQLNAKLEPATTYDPDPFEANWVTQVQTLTATAGADGTASVPVTLSVLADGSALHHFAAVVVDTEGRTGPMSDTVVLEFDPDAVIDDAVARINVGGSEYVDTLGRTWLGDAGTAVGTVYQVSAAVDVLGTEDDPIYRTERFGDPLVYPVAVPNGTYEVELHLAEIFQGVSGSATPGTVGARVFSATVEGEVVFTDLDLFAQDGPATARVETIVVEVVDGQLDVVLDASADNAKLSGIVVTPTGPAPGTVTVSPTSLALDGLESGTSASGTVTVTNGTAAPVTLQPGLTSGVDAVLFSSTPTAPVEVPPGGTLDVEVTFAPTEAGTAVAQLELDAGGTAPLLVDLAGSAVTTTSTGGDATVAVPLQATLVQPVPGTVALDVVPRTAADPSGFVLFGDQLDLTGPVATAATPHVLVLEADASVLPAGDVVVFLDGVAVADCTDASAAVPDPCVVDSVPDADGDLVVTVRTSAAGTWTLGSALVDPPSGDILYRVNAGGPELTATDGDIAWSADQSAVTANGAAELGVPSPYVNSGEGAGADTTFGVGVATVIDLTAVVDTGAELEALFETERYRQALAGQPPMTWTFPVDPGSYEVVLLGAEVWNNEGSNPRVMDVVVEGQTVVSSLRWSAVAGATNTAVEVVVPVTVTDTDIVVELSPVSQNPKLSAIEVRRAGPAPTGLAPTVLAIDDVTVDAGTAVDVDVATTEPDGDVVTLDVSGPDFVTLVDAGDGTGTLTIAPTEADAGAYTVTVGASDDQQGVGTPASFTLTVVDPSTPGQVLHRVNAGGSAVTATDGGPDWSIDTAASPSPFKVAGSNSTSNHGNPVSVDATVPSTTPAGIWPAERWDTAAAPEMAWAFPVTTGQPVEVRLYLRDGFAGTNGVGLRVFDVLVDGTLVLDDFDPTADVGWNVGTMRSFQVVSDGMVDIEFLHVVENPSVRAIEIVTSGPQPGVLSAGVPSLGFGSIENATTATQTVTLTNLGEAGDPDITVQDVQTTGAAFSAVLTGPTVVAPGATTTVDVTYAPTATGPDQGGVEIVHDGIASPVSVAVSGESFDPGAAPVGFSSAGLPGANVNNPTSLEFGPDGRLYVSQQNGTIWAYTVQRDGVGNYSILDTEQIEVIKQITNHDDDGTTNTTALRQVTGIMTAGTPANPELYVTSSDWRIGGGGSGADQNLDTNSGVLSHLTWNGAGWDRVDLVRGLPRSEENHATNGLDLDPATNTLYVMSGGHANKGAPSNNFAQTPEYALSAAMLSVDLDALDALGTSVDPRDGSTFVYDLPTLDDPTRNDALTDPFGGNNGLNMAIIDPSGPVQVYSPGYRNAYDVVLSQDGQLYTWDNGPNTNWGGIPIAGGDTDGNGFIDNGETAVPASPGVCSNISYEGGSNFTGDGLHYVTEGYYGGHPNPVRGSADSGIYVYDSIGGNWQLVQQYDWTDFPTPPVPASEIDPRECVYEQAGIDDGSLVVINSSTNGLTEYTASNFGGELAGDLLAAAFNGNIYRVELTADGTDITNVDSLFSGFGATPLDVSAVGDGGVFPGTVWAATYGADAITVFEPDDYDGGSGTTCTGADDPSLDEDNDGFDNADELAAGTDPCNGGSQPTDFDGDGTSDVTDPDDDGDGVLDVVDAFARDAANGLTTPLPVTRDFDGAGVFDLGFTGLMTNGVDTWLEQFDEADLDAGGATEKLSVSDIPVGDAYQGVNTQEDAFQYGIAADVNSPPFVVHSQIESPYFTAGTGTQVPSSFQSNGIQLGTGSQDDYLKLVFGAGGTQVLLEVGGTTTSSNYSAAVTGDFLAANAVDLYLTVDPSSSTVQPSISLDGGTTVVDLGAPVAIPSAWLSATDDVGLAVGLIATSTGSVPFTATWDFLNVDLVGTQPPSGSGAAALVQVLDGNGNINASTYGSNAFTVVNEATGAEQITQVSFDLRGALFPDLVFDPDGTAGDTTSKGFTPDTGGVATGLVGATDTLPLDGTTGEDGYSGLEITFDDFGPGESFGFSIDNDPTSIKGEGAPGPNQSGSVSGLELVGSTVTIAFDDGTELVGELWSDGSNAGAVAVLAPDPAPAPTIAVAGVTAPAVVADAAQDVVVTGTPGAEVQLLRVGAGLFLPAGGGYDIDPFEANSATEVELLAAVQLDGTGSATIPVTLSRDESPQAALNHLVAVELAADGVPGRTSEVLVLELDPAAPGSGTVVARINAGGPLVAATDGGPDWAADPGATPSANLSAAWLDAYALDASVSNTYTKAGSFGALALDASVPAGTPVSIFDTERWDATGGPVLGYEFPFSTGVDYRVNLYMAEIFSTAVGFRSFDVVIDGQAAFTGVDVVDLFGAKTAGVLGYEFSYASEPMLIEFLHGAANNPKVNAIEVVQLP